MKKNVEVEYMGDLSNNEFIRLKKLFSKEAEFKKEEKRFSFLYVRDKIPEDVEEIKDEKVDLRLRVTNKVPELILKYGHFSGSHARKEISIDFSLDKIENVIELLCHLDWNIGVIYVTRTLVYMYENIEFSLVEIEDYGYTFEAEILAHEEDVESAKKKIETSLKKLNLKPFTREGLNKMCNLLNNKKELQFDFKKQSFKEFKDKYESFFR